MKVIGRTLFVLLLAIVARAQLNQPQRIKSNDPKLLNKANSEIYHRVRMARWDILRLAPRSDAPVNKQKGDIYYDSDVDLIYYWNGTDWTQM